MGFYKYYLNDDECDNYTNYCTDDNGNNYIYKNDCVHNRVDDYKGDIMCFDCGEVLDYFPIRTLIKKERITEKEKKYNKTMKQMFPDLIFPQGNVEMRDIEQKYNLKKEPGDRFPNMKNIIHFILTYKA